MKLVYQEQSPGNTLLVVVTWIIGALLAYYGVTNLLPLVSTIVITSSLLFKIFIYLMSTLIGCFMLFYSILCIMQT